LDISLALGFGDGAGVGTTDEVGAAFAAQPARIRQRSARIDTLRASKVTPRSKATSAIAGAWAPALGELDP